ncbi:MAG: L,D-transpeptidase family protein [Paracoccus sp. (in: a-proteobacteria)]|nr:L,D-transpeptidase family protein [Paracoccus sp. (in: a-proteobacteria)]
MIRSRRAVLALGGAAILSACSGGSGDGRNRSGNKFLTYNGPAVTQIVVNKGARQMHLLNGRTVLRSYRVHLGNEPLGHKQFEGDGRTPEGIYFIDRFNPNSAFHLSAGISYPNVNDTAFALAHGRRPGGDIFIHGRGPEGAAAALARRADWTAGCIAVEDHEIEEIYAMLQTGVPVVINA